MIRKNAKTSLDNRAVGYVRRSTDRQEQSIPDQKKAIEQYATEHEFHLDRFYVDDAISGTSTLGRRAFQKMVKDAQGPARNFDVIIVYDVKRFGRIDNDEAGYYRHLLRTNGVEVRYVSENFNGDCTDDLLRPVKQWQARQESKDLSKVTIRGLLSKSETGHWMGGTPPYGYDLLYENADGKFLFILRYMPDGSKQILDKNGKLTRTLIRGESLSISKQDHARLTPSSTQRVEVIKRIFKMYAEQGKGFKSLAYTLNLEDIPTARGPQWSHIYSGTWTDTTIRAILVNPIYVGDMVWNRRTDARFHRISGGRAIDRDSVHGARLVPNDKSDWITIRDAHPALVSRRLFQQARQRLDSRIESIEQRGLDPRLKTSGRTWAGKRSRFILSGLIKCSLCGSRYQGVKRYKGRKHHGIRTLTFYYGCGGYITKGKKICNFNPIPQNILENKIIDTVLDFYRPYLEKNGREKMARAVKTQIGSEGKDLDKARERAETEKERISGIINNLLDNITSTNRRYVDKRLDELKKQRQQLEDRLEELERISLSQAEIDNIVTEAMQFIGGLVFTLRQGLPQEKLVALRQCIEKIRVNKPAGEIKLAICQVPAGNLQDTIEVKIFV